jgi:hypothetical protein
MKLRNHPLMSNKSGRNWPPIWKEKFGDKILTGEIGVLTHVGSDPQWKHHFYLHITYGDLPFVGSLVFDNIIFRHRVSVLLTRHIGRTLREIGDLEL